MPVKVTDQFQFQIFGFRADSGARGQQTYSVVGFNERIVDSDDFDVIVLDGISEDNTTNAAETIDANLDGSHDSACGVSVMLRRGER
jgi:glycosyltransferase involved in cell wall biosynthesis